MCVCVCCVFMSVFLQSVWVSGCQGVWVSLWLCDCVKHFKISRDRIRMNGSRIRDRSWKEVNIVNPRPPPPQLRLAIFFSGHCYLGSLKSECHGERALWIKGRAGLLLYKALYYALPTVTLAAPCHTTWSGSGREGAGHMSAPHVG